MLILKPLVAINEFYFYVWCIGKEEEKANVTFEKKKPKLTYFFLYTYHREKSTRLLFCTYNQAPNTNLGIVT